MHETFSRFDVRRVVVILAGPRTGSSFLFKALNSRGLFWSPPGEDTPYLRQAGLGNFSGPDYSDEITEAPDKDTLDRVGRAMLQDVGLPTTSPGESAAFSRTLLRRLILQWPACALEPWKSDAEKLLVELAAGTEPHQLYHLLVDRLQASGAPVDTSLFSASGPAPLSLPLVEEPPYIRPGPRLPPRAKQDFPLLLKTSTHLYRLPLLRALFPRAEFRWILLRRNPSASISALVDGWLSSGFHSHDVSSHLRLSISGYSDVVPGGEHFWKFDLPPGWKDFASRPLPEVAAFQWRSSHEKLRDFSAGEPSFSLIYEDLLDPSLRAARLADLLRFSGAQPRPHPLWDDREPVAAVSPPAARKWTKRKKVLDQLYEFEPGLLRLAHELGYGDPGAWV